MDPVIYIPFCFALDMQRRRENSARGQRVLQRPSSRELDAEAREEHMLVGDRFRQGAVPDRRSALGAYVHVVRTQARPAPFAHPVPARNKCDGVAFLVLLAYTTE